jgi:hypothetical protein
MATTADSQSSRSQPSKLGGVNTPSADEQQQQASGGENGGGPGHGGELLVGGVPVSTIFFFRNLKTTTF